MKKALFIYLLSLCCMAMTAQVRIRNFNPKLSAQTVRLIESAAQTRVANSEKKVNVYVHLADDADTSRLSRTYGVKFNVRCGNVCTALVPVAMLDELASDDNVTAVDAGQEVHSMMDAARMYANVDAVHAGGQLSSPYDGSGVLVGIIDAGFDFNHPNFRDKDGKCRILAVWDQNNFFSTSSSYGYGVEYDTTEKVVAAARDMELTGDTHGTHVAGIAAGSYDGPYLGVAPGADIVLVSTQKTEQGIIDGLDYLLKYAEKAGRPMAINLSIGTVLGYKDGTDDFTVMVDNLMKGQQGRILSIAAGNEGDRHSTLLGRFSDGINEVKSIWSPPDYNRDNLFVQGEAGSVYRLTLTLKDKNSGEVLLSQAFDSDKRQSQSFENFGSHAEDNGTMSVSVAENPANGNPYFRISMAYGKPGNEQWEITLGAESGTYMINSDYGEFSSGGLSGYTEGSNECTIAATATGYNTVSVGAFVSKNQYIDLSGTEHKQPWTVGDIYPLSGKGPTFDGRIKPDVVAPGAAVVSSFSSYAGAYYVKTEEKVAEVTDETSGRKYTWGVASGTSMATPVVTGIVALWLEASPRLTVDDVMETIKATSQHDGYTGDEPNGVFGNGKIDALAGLKYLSQISGITPKTLAGVKCECRDGVLRVYGDATIRQVKVLRADGTTVKTVSVHNSDACIDVPQGGVYLIRIITDNGQETLKLAI